MPNRTYILKYEPQVKLSGIWSKIQVSAKGNFGAIAIRKEETMPLSLITTDCFACQISNITSAEFCV